MQCRIYWGTRWQLLNGACTTGEWPTFQSLLYGRRELLPAWAKWTCGQSILCIISHSSHGCNSVWLGLPHSEYSASTGIPDRSSSTSLAPSSSTCTYLRDPTDQGVCVHTPIHTSTRWKQFSLRGASFQLRSYRCHLTISSCSNCNSNNNDGSISFSIWAIKPTRQHTTSNDNTLDSFATHYNISNHRYPLPSGALQWVALWKTPSNSWQSRWWRLHGHDFTRSPWSTVCWRPPWATNLPTRWSPHTWSLTWKTAQPVLLLLTAWERKRENGDLAFSPAHQHTSRGLLLRSIPGQAGSFHHFWTLSVSVSEFCRTWYSPTVGWILHTQVLERPGPAHLLWWRVSVWREYIRDPSPGPHILPSPLTDSLLLLSLQSPLLSWVLVSTLALWRDLCCECRSLL